MNILVKRCLGFIFGAVFVCFMAWVAGFDFDERGEVAFITALLAFTFGVFLATYPHTDSRYD